MKGKVVQWYLNVDCDKLKMHIVNPRTELSHRRFCSDGNVPYLY